MMGSHIDGLGDQPFVRLCEADDYSPPGLHDHVGGHLKEDVESEKDSQTGRVLRRG